MSLLQEF